MQIYWLRQFWFGEVAYDDAALHKHFHTITFAHRPNIDAQIWLTIFSTGAKWSGGAIMDIGRELLASIAKDSDRAAKDLDALKTKPRRSGTALRVDVKMRKVIVDRRHKQTDVFVAESPRRP